MIITAKHCNNIVLGPMTLFCGVNKLWSADYLAQPPFVCDNPFGPSIWTVISESLCLNESSLRKPFKMKMNWLPVHFYGNQTHFGV